MGSYEDLQLLAKTVVQDEIVRQSYTMRLHGMPTSVIEITHIAVVEITDTRRAHLLLSLLLLRPTTIFDYLDLLNSPRYIIRMICYD